MSKSNSTSTNQKSSNKTSVTIKNKNALAHENPLNRQVSKKALAFDIDQTLNIAKTPIPPEIAELLRNCLDYFEICPISGQKFEQFLIQIVEPLREVHVSEEQLSHLHLFVAQGTQYYRYDLAQHDWQQVYNYPLPESDVVKITTILEKSARDLGYWEADQLQDGDEIIENRLSQVTFSALGQSASTDVKYAWDPDCKKREAIVEKCREQLPDFLFEIGGTTSINVAKKGMNKEFGMTHLLEELGVEKSEVLYFGDMTQPGGNDYPVVQMSINTITVRSHEDTAFALRGILGIIKS